MDDEAKMRIGYLDYTLGLSIRIYVDRIVQEIRNLGISMVPFGFGDPLPEDVDVYWDPRQTATTLPTERFNKAKKPCVATKILSFFVLKVGFGVFVTCLKIGT